MMPTPGVVVVDDAVDLRMLVERAIRRDGRLRLLAAVGDGQAGVDAVLEHHPDVVLMDLSMPVMDGITATREIKRLVPDTLVLVLTGYGDERVEGEARAAGADAFLDKSQPLDRVIAVLAELTQA